MSEDHIKEAEEVDEQVDKQVEEDNDSDDDSDESVASEDSEPGSNEIIRTTGNFKIPVDENNLSPNTVIKLNLSNGDTIQTEYKYIQYFKELTKNILPCEPDDGSDDESDNDVVINAFSISKDTYMTYSAELYNLCDNLNKIYTPSEDATDKFVYKAYDVIKDMDANGIPKYCQDWIKSKKLIELETYVQSSTDTTNLSGLFGCPAIQNLVSYWCVYLYIHKDIALNYCDEEYYNELAKTCSETVGVYNPDRFK